MDGSLIILLGTALSVGAIHTLVGVDHYLPFIVLGKAEGWTLRKTLFWTVICGLGHVLSSILLGVVGLGLGYALVRLKAVEAARGDLAGLVLIGFGALYLGWGLWRGRRGHVHLHVHGDGSVHRHPHEHEGEHPPDPHRPHGDHDDGRHRADHQRTLWVLFIFFVLGPCEPLIPLIAGAAASHGAAGAALLAIVFSATTLLVMVSLVALGSVGIGLFRLGSLQRWAHAMAGFAVLVSGLLIRYAGL